MEQTRLANDEQIVHTLHHATMLPLSLYRDGQCVLSYPNPPPSLARVLEDTDVLNTLQVSRGQPYTPQYVATPYEERFLYFELGGNRALLIGAFLPSPKDSSDIYRLVRRLHLPISAHQQLLTYFETLPIADESRHFYLGHLLQLLFRVQRLGEPEYRPAPKEDIGPLLFQRTYENRMELFNHPPFFLEQLMVQSVTGGDRRTALRTLSEINALSRATLAREPLRSLKNSLICSCTLFTRAAISGGASAQRAFTLSDTYIHSMEAENDMQVLEGIEEQMLLSFIELVEERQRELHNPVTRAAIRYIDEHLAERLTLQRVAAEVFVHPAYLSKRFHQDTGETLGTYIQRRRIEEAQHFMRHTQSPVSEISSFYQFCSQSHFIQVFKKHTGKTPQAFRKELVE